ncbi:MAG: alanine racemase [Myxococcales bacterium]|jgi:alanine racemase
MQVQLPAAADPSAPTPEGPGAGQSPPPRPTRAQIDLDALAHNLSVLRQVAHGSRVFAVVKADAYGHGLVPVAKRLERERVDGLCVALAEEGLTLRAAGVTTPILVLNGAYGDAHARVVAAHLLPTVYSLDQIRAFDRVAVGTPVGVHLKVDTGMARLGVPLDELGAVLDGLEHMRGVRIDGVMTHLSSADTDARATEEQLERFAAAVAMVRDRGHRPRLVHAANSAGTYGYPHAREDLVRAGISLYGVTPEHPEGGPMRVDAPALRPVMSVHTEVMALRTLPPGAPVGYDQTFRARRTTRVATVPIGYGDGLMRAASNRGAMLVGERVCPIIGRISMDLTTLDVTEVESCRVGDPVVLLGSQGGASLDATDLARACDTIAYEVLTSISPRVPRNY